MPWRSFILLASCLIAVPCAAEPRYFGLNVPRGQPEPFRPAIFANLGVLTATGPAFSPDLRRFVFTTVNTETPGQTVLAIFESRFDGKDWSSPAHAKELHRPGFNSAEPAFSPDGKWLYFDSNQPPGTPPWNVKIFRARVTETGFETAQLVNLDVPAAAGTFYPRLDTSGALMFTSDGLPGKGGGDLYVAPAREDGSFGPPQNVDGDFNSDRDDWDLVEHPNRRLRLWASGRSGGAGRIDIYFSRKNKAGQWSPAQNLTAVNTAAVETAPSLTPDGETLFFHRTVDGRDRIFWVQIGSVLPAE